MVKPEKLYRGMLAAWEMLIDFPLPAEIRAPLRRGCDPVSRAAGFPLVGVTVGLALVSVAWFCSVVFNEVAGSVVFAVLATAFLDLKDSGRGLGLQTSLFLLRGRRVPLTEALPALNSADLNAVGSPAAAVFLALLEVLKILFLFMLSFFHAKLWIVTVLVGAFTVQGVLAMQPDVTTQQPFIPLPPESRVRIWRPFAVIFVLMMLVFPIGMIVAGAAVYFIATGLSRWFDRTFGGVSAAWITLVGAVTELGLLALGILFALHTH